jgi:hypothetical protein
MMKKITAVIGMMVCVMMMATGVVWSAGAPKGVVSDTKTKKVPSPLPPGTTTAPIQATETGTVKDPNTGLIWVKDANCFGKQNWGEAMNSANMLKAGSCSLRDGSHAGQWRLPTKEELIMRQRNKQGFDFIQADGYWSSSPVANKPDQVWAVDMRNGYEYNCTKVSSFKYYVWPVRAGN